MSDCFPKLQLSNQISPRRHTHDSATAPPRSRRGSSTGADARMRRYCRPQASVQKMESGSCFSFTAAHLFGQGVKGYSREIQSNIHPPNCKDVLGEHAAGSNSNHVKSDDDVYASATCDANKTPVAIAPPDREDLPFTGKALAVRVKCSNRAEGELHISEYLGVRVTSDWTVTLLQEAIEAKSGVHRACQTLMYKGRALEKDKTLESILASHRIAVNQIPEHIKFWAQVDEERFPECLRPLCFGRVPLGHTDFELPSCGGGCRRLSVQFSEEGFYWQIPEKVLDWHGLCPPSCSSGKRAKSVHGQASPLSKITLDPSVWEAACIPQAAKHFAWVSPVADWKDVTVEPFLANSWEEESRNQTAALSNFLRIGGFIYFGDDDQVVGVTTLYEPELGDVGGFQFEKPRRWHPEWTRALVEQDRFQDVNIGSLEDTGARLFCWLYPGETFKSAAGSLLANQPRVPHGGFVYLFHKAPFEATDSQFGMDRYFAVSAASGMDTVAKPSTSTLRSFQLIGGDPAKDHPSASSDKFEVTISPAPQFYDLESASSPQLGNHSELKSISK